MFFPTHNVILDMSPTDFEKYSLQILQQQMQGLSNCRFEHNKIIKVIDGNYQIDGYIEFSIMGVLYKTLVECKHYKSSIEREKIQVLHDKLRSCGAQKGIMVSSSNFQSGAITYATHHGIALIQLTPEGNQYATRSMPDTFFEHQHTPYDADFPYIGVKLESHKERITHLSYLSPKNMKLKEFLESDEHFS